MFEKVKENSKWIMTGGSCLLAAVALSYQLTTQHASGVEQEYHALQLNLEKLKGGDAQVLPTLERAMKKRASFRGIASPSMVQFLLDQKKVKEAKVHAKKGGQSPLFYEEFSRCSFLISSQDLVLALTEARGLMQKLPPEGYDLLKGFNLLRIALLEKEVGTKQGELETWNQIKSLDADTLAALEKVFSVKEITLKDFIRYRELTR